MVQPPTNFMPPTNEQDAAADVQQPQNASSQRPVAPMPDDGSKKPFKEVLNKKLQEKEVKQPIAKLSDDEDDKDKVSLLDLAATGTPVKEVKKATVIDTSALLQEETEEAEKLAAKNADADLPLPVKPTVKQAPKVVADAPAPMTVATPKPKVAPEEPKVAAQGTKVPVKQKVDATADIGAGKPKQVDKVTVKAAADDKTDVAADVPKEKKVTAVAQPKESQAGVVTAQPQVVAQVAASAPVQVKAPDDVNKTRQTLLQLAQQMVNSIQLIKAPDRTDTTLTLQYPPLFAGVDVTITEFNSSQKQFNVTFTNLNDPTARMLIELPANQQRLQQALVDRGYTLQMITVEPKIPGLQSLETGDVSLKERPKGDNQADSSTDKEGKPA